MDEKQRTNKKQRRERGRRRSTRPSHHHAHHRPSPSLLRASHRRATTAAHPLPSFHRYLLPLSGSHSLASLIHVPLFFSLDEIDLCFFLFYEIPNPMQIWKERVSKEREMAERRGRIRILVWI
jgi:hypothetical protein